MYVQAHKLRDVPKSMNKIFRQLESFDKKPMNF